MKTISILISSILSLSLTGVVSAAPWHQPTSPRRHHRPTPPPARPVPPRVPQKAKHRATYRDRTEYKAQFRLRELGYYRGPLDGQFGRLSQRALLRFQRDRRIRQTGRLDAITLRALKITPTPQRHRR